MAYRTKLNTSVFIHLAFFMLFSLGMVFYRAYSAAAILLLLLSFYVIAQYRREIDFKAEKSIVYGLLFFAVLNIAVNIIAGHSSRDYEFAIRVLLIIPILYMLVKTGFNRNLFILFVGLGGVAMGLAAMYDVYVLKWDRAGVFPLRFAYIASWQVIVSLVSLAFLDKNTEKKSLIIWISVLGIIGGLTASVLSGTRGSWIFLFAALFVLGIYAIFQFSTKVKVCFAIVLSGLLIASGTLLMTDNYISKRLDIAVAEISNYKPNSQAAMTSLGQRFELWRVSTQLIEEHPLMGIGTKNFHKNLQKLVDEKQMLPFMLHLKHFHNDIIEEAVTNGLPVAIAIVICLYLLPFIAFARRLGHASKETHYYAVLGCMLVMAWVIFGLTEVFLSTNHGAIYYLLNMVIIWSGMRVSENRYLSKA